MRRYLIVAHRTLGGDHLIEHVRMLREDGPCRFLLLVPVEHPSGHPWTEGEVNATARKKLQEGLDRFHEEGIIVLSTLPPGPSRWIHWDVPSRMHREFPNVEITHLVAERVPAH
jgi:hypothetical protein